MPSLRNRNQGKGGSEAPMTLMSAMGLPGKAKHGPPHNSKDYLFDNVKEGKSSGKTIKASHAGYDTKTRLALGSKKESGSRKRAHKDMKAK